MRALTICQPYAHLIVTGAKRVENRRWYPSSFDGRHKPPFDLLIHAGKSHAWLSLDDMTLRDTDYGIPFQEMAFGAVVGVARLVACVGPYDQSGRGLNYVPDQYAWIRQHEHASGPFCWILDRVRRFPEPVPFRGRQQIFEVPDALVAEQLAVSVEHASNTG